MAEEKTWWGRLGAMVGLTGDELQPEVDPMTLSRRQFLGAAIASTLVAADPLSAAPEPAAPEVHTNSMPSTMAGLRALDDAQKTLLAIATVSGCDGVAYYAVDNGALKLQQQMDIYPTIPIQFSPTASYNSRTHDLGHVATSSEYHLPVFDKNGQVQGLVVLHAPHGAFSHVRTEAEAKQPDNMNESPETRIAKLEMAQHILDNQRTTLLPKHQRQLEEKPKGFEDKKRYFEMLRDDFLHVIGADSTQAQHVNGVADLMMITVDKVVNTPDKKIIDDAHRAMLKDITVLHDVGKLQTSVPFITKQWRADETDLGKSRNKYFMGQNHNHPLFTYTALSAYPHEALTTASHHHGLLRYTEKEMEKGMGEAYAEFRILKDNCPFNELPALSKFMRVCDVTQAMTDRGNKPIAHAIKEMASRAGYDADSKSFKPVDANCNSFDPDYLCMMIANGFFTEYGKTNKGSTKYDKLAVETISQEVLTAFKWEERKGEIEKRLRDSVAKDAFLAPEREQARNR